MVLLLSGLSAVHAHPLADSIAGSVPITDTLIHLPTSDNAQKPSPLDAPVYATAQDSIQYDISGRYVHLYGNAEVKYKDIQFNAGFIQFDMQQNTLYATGITDAQGQVSQEPVYQEGADKYTMTSMTYNFETKQARILGVMTQVTDGYLHGEIVKKLPNDDVNVYRGKFTTCDEKHPHFYIALSKAKVIPHDKIVTGPAYLVLADVPTPLVLPFGFFPNTSKRSSGIIIPEYGEENQRGFFLRNGGIYLGISDYFDLTLLGGFYTKGSWDANLRMNYRRRYRASGSLSVTYSQVTFGHKGSSDYVSDGSYMINWNHSMDRKASPNSSFQASVSYGSSGFNRYNSQTTQQYLNNQTMSSVSFSHQFPGTPVSLGLSINQSHNSRDSMVNFRFPQFTLNVARIHPFKRKRAVGPQRWYERIGFNYSTNLQNTLNIKQDRLFTKDALRLMRNGMQHNASISSSFTLLKYINISPSISYNANWYLESQRQHWDPEQQRIVRDTVKGFARSWQFNTSLGLSTRLYGMYTFREKSRLKAIRHVLSPAVSLSYHPDFSLPIFKMYRDVQENAAGKMRKYSIFEGSLYGGPPQGDAGNIGLSLNNNIEMKVRSQKDTATNERVIPLLESLSFSTSYNMLADSLHWSPLSISARTSILNTLQLSAQSRFTPYDCLDDGRTIKDYYIKRTKSPLRFMNFSLSASLSLSKTLTGKGRSQLPPQPLGYLPGFFPFGEALSTDFLIIDYGDFSAPWSLSCSYNYSFSKNGKRVQSVQSVSLYGSFTLAERWRFGFSTGYDFNRRQVNMTTLNIACDLHCWEMSVNIIPFGTMRSYSFRIGVKAGMLQDLKFEKRQSYIDNMTF